jgi:hypothetical protein
MRAALSIDILGNISGRYHSHFLTPDLLTILTAQKHLTCAYISIIAEP